MTDRINDEHFIFHNRAVPVGIQFHLAVFIVPAAPSRRLGDRGGYVYGQILCHRLTKFGE